MVDSGLLDLAESAIVRYLRLHHAGVLGQDETWLGDAVHTVEGTLEVPDGTTLELLPGAVIKFQPAGGILVHEGGRLTGNGAVAKPIIATSMKDDTVGGDTTGNGVGDLEGVIAHLDHLEWLGVDAIWLSPVFTSPMVDHGYDVADYCDIEPLFGDLDEFDRLLEDDRSLDRVLQFAHVSGPVVAAHRLQRVLARHGEEHALRALREVLLELVTLPSSSPSPHPDAVAMN